MYLIIMNWGMIPMQAFFMQQIQSPVIEILSYSKNIIQIDLMYGNN